MSNTRTLALLAHYPIISDQITRKGLKVVLGELENILQQNVAGDIVELGCYIGTTSLFIRRLLDEYGESEKHTFHAYDSFEGLPAKAGQDQSAVGVDFKAGELAVSKKLFLHEFQKARLVSPTTHKKWFDQLTDKDLPDKIAFAFLDGDFYDSILASLKLVWPRLHADGTIVVDDYQRAALPGATQAITDFFRDKPAVRIRQENNLGIIKR